MGDGVAGAAVRAVRERVAVTPVRRIAHVREAVAAGRHIRADQHGVAVVPLAVRDGEGRLAVRKGQFLAAEGRDPRERRQFVFEGVGKGGQSLIGSLHLHPDAVRRVAHMPGEPEPGCGTVYERPETNPLDLSADDIAVSFHVALPLCPKKEALRPISVLPPEKREKAAGAPPVSVFRHHSRP